VLRCVAVSCIVFQCVSVCCIVSECVAVCCGVLQCVLFCSSVFYFLFCSTSEEGMPVYLLQCFTLCCSVLQFVAEWHRESQSVALYYRAMQCVPFSCCVRAAEEISLKL